MFNYITKELLDDVEKNIIEYHKGMFSKISIKAAHWEAILNDAFQKQGHKTTWDCRSHQVGADIEIKNLPNGRVSCKGGCFRGRVSSPKVKVSSFRSAKIKTLEEKLSYFDNDHEDVIISLASTNTINQPVWVKNLKFDYLIGIFAPFSFSNLKWKKTASDGWASRGGLIEADIYKGASGQLWYGVPLDLIELKREIFINGR